MAAKSTRTGSFKTVPGKPAKGSPYKPGKPTRNATAAAFKVGAQVYAAPTPALRDVVRMHFTHVKTSR